MTEEPVECFPQGAGVPRGDDQARDPVPVDVVYPGLQAGAYHRPGAGHGFQLDDPVGLVAGDGRQAEDRAGMEVREEFIPGYPPEKEDLLFQVMGRGHHDQGGEAPSLAYHQEPAPHPLHRFEEVLDPLVEDQSPDEEDDPVPVLPPDLRGLRGLFRGRFVSGGINPDRHYHAFFLKIP